jgi:hypothetical protein
MASPITKRDEFTSVDQWAVYFANQRSEDRPGSPSHVVVTLTSFTVAYGAAQNQAVIRPDQPGAQATGFAENTRRLPGW